MPSYAEHMRWDGLFDDLEAHWADLGWRETAAEAAELTRAEWMSLSLADRLRGAREERVRLHLIWGEVLEGVVHTVGQDWTGVHVAGAGSAVVPLGRIAAVEAGLERAVPAPATPAAGLGAVLRRIARTRTPVVVTGLQGAAIVEGTVDRVGHDHLDVARHPRDEARRAVAVRGRLVVPFGALGLVRTGLRMA